MSLPPGLYGIADAGFGDPLALGLALLRGGARVVQLRCKGWPAHEVAAIARRLHPRCQEAGVPLILNDHPALLHLADGVHLGQGDGPLPPGPGLRGRSTHDLDQVRAAAAEGADYIGFGPVFGTATKVGALPARGLEALAAAVAASPLPVVAIGGIDPARLPSVKATGVRAWAVISAILSDPDPSRAARRMA